MKSNSFFTILALVFSFTSCVHLDYTRVKADPDLPIIYLDSVSLLESNENRRTFTGRLSIYANTSQWRNSEGRPLFLNEVPLIHSKQINFWIRGQSSKDILKHSFSIEFYDNQALLNFPKEKDFVLHSAYFNASLMPNYLAYTLSNLIGVWAPKAQFVELYGSQLEENLNPEYQGIYLLLEKIKRDKNRVSIKSLSPKDKQEPEISGGYLIKNDKYSPGDIAFKTDSGITITFESPKSKEVTPDQITYLKGYFDDFEKSTRALDPTKPEAFGEYIDLDSFADHLMMNEAIANVDGLKYSSFFSKDRNGKLKSGPLWDNDLSMGQTRWGNASEKWEHNDDFTQWTFTHSWYIVHSKNHPQWWKNMLHDPVFFKRVQDRWKRMKLIAFNEKNVNELIDQALKKMGVKKDPETKAISWGHFEDNERRWTWEELGYASDVFPGTVIYEPEGLDRFDVNIRYLKEWLKSRFEWLNQEKTWDELRRWAQSTQ